MLTEAEIRQWLDSWERVAAMYGAGRLDEGFIAAVYLMLGQENELVGALAAAKRRVRAINAERQAGQ